MSAREGSPRSLRQPDAGSTAAEGLSAADFRPRPGDRASIPPGWLNSVFIATRLQLHLDEGLQETLSKYRLLTKNYP
jgi:hypothetical protein